MLSRVDVAAGYLTCYSICSADLWSEGLVCAQELIPTMNEINSMCFVQLELRREVAGFSVVVVDH